MSSSQCAVCRGIRSSMVARAPIVHMINVIPHACPSHLCIEKRYQRKYMEYGMYQKYSQLIVVSDR